MQLKHINSLLLAIIIVINLYIIAAPFLPRLLFAVQNTEAVKVLEQEALTAPADNYESADAPANALIVPSMKLKEPIHEVASTRATRNDIWRRPNTSTPNKGGNTVLVGHRFTYANPTGVLYHLDKVTVGDTIALTWEGKRYIYKVASTQVVKATAIEVEANTETPQLTLYSCTPLWNPKDRLVITAPLEAIL